MVTVTVTFQINTPNTTAHRITTNICVWLLFLISDVFQFSHRSRRCVGQCWNISGLDKCEDIVESEPKPRPSQSLREDLWTSRLLGLEMDQLSASIQSTPSGRSSEEQNIQARIFRGRSIRPSQGRTCVFECASLKSPKVSASPDMLRILLFPLRAARECKCFTDLLPNNVSLLQLGTFQTYFWSSCLLVGIRVTTEHNSYITAMKSDGAK